MNNIIEIKTIKELKKYRFRIPLYQREYAWGEDEVEQLISDLETFQEKKVNKKYFLGNIVVDEIYENYYDVIDGQQRLTTLYLLMNLLDEEVYELNYEIREEDDKFLKNLKDKSIEELKRNYKNVNPNFIVNIETIKKKKVPKNLLDNVIATITKIPKEMDVIKYFEVMNNRGKQLEKHQILKAKFLQQLKQDDSKNWAKIWDYCSYMNSPIEDLIYYNLSKNEKKENKVEEIRKNLLSFNYDNYFSSEFIEKEETIKKILNEDEILNEEDIKSKYEYRSIIKFPIFLIHVLKIFIIRKELEGKNGFRKLNEIKINDKDLLNYFYKDNTHIEFLFDTQLAKEFLELMFELRILFDYFVIKRDNNDEPFIFRNDDKKLIMIELLFVNSAPQYFAQHWIGVFLKWVYENKNEIMKFDDKVDFDNEKAIKFLGEFDNELAKIRLSDEEISDFIDKKIKNFEKRDINITKKLEYILNQGTATPHYWFYKLDYLLWKNYNWNQKFKNKFDENDKFKYSEIKNSYRLTRLHSIEHIYPQNKKDNWKCEECKECANNDCIDCFGNLSLITNHLNSILLDKDYQDKRLKIQEQLNHGTIESLKMLLIYSKYNKWNEENCKNHYEEMLNILKTSLNLKSN